MITTTRFSRGRQVGENSKSRVGEGKDELCAPSSSSWGYFLLIWQLVVLFQI